MQLQLEREIYRLHPEWPIKKVEEYAKDVASYWIYECLPDVLEADNL